MVIKVFPSLKSYFLSLEPNEEDGRETTTRNNRIIHAFKHPLAEVLLNFLHTALPPLIHLNFLLPRSDPIIRILYNVLFTRAKQILSRFTSLELVGSFSNDEVTITQIKGKVMKDANILNTSRMFVALLLCKKFNELIDKGEISEREVDMLCSSFPEFHHTAFIYVIDNSSLKMSFCSTHVS